MLARTIVSKQTRNTNSEPRDATIVIVLYFLELENSATWIEFREIKPFQILLGIPARFLGTEVRQVVFSMSLIVLSKCDWTNRICE